MAVKLYNSLTRSVDPLEPRNPPALQMFVCGPTVYDRIHIGNARTFTVFDALAKWLRYRRFDVRYVQNITDVDDKIILRAAEQSRDPLEYARDYEQKFLDDMRTLGNTAVDEYARATDHIPQVVGQVKTLIAKGNVYLIEGDGWYFDLSTFPDYGKLSGRTGLAAEDAVSRIDDAEKKRNAGDFCVWKLSKQGEPVWEDAELGAGRPGWHIEDTAITEHVFGPQYDLHGGAVDLRFPHHEAEIAQQEAASGLVPFVRHWVHAGFLQAAGERMGKSKGNFITLHEAFMKWSVPALRFFFLSNHYRSPLEFSDASLNAASAAVARIGELARKVGKAPVAEVSLAGMEEALDDDLNTPKAFAAMFEIIRTANAAGTVPHPAFFSFLTDVFGIGPAGDEELPDEVRELVDERTAAREAKDYAASDTLRDRLKELGYAVDDTPYGPLVKKSSP